MQKVTNNSTLTFFIWQLKHYQIYLIWVNNNATVTTNINHEIRQSLISWKKYILLQSNNSHSTHHNYSQRLFWV